jgi:hypothetical protein
MADSEYDFTQSPCEITSLTAAIQGSSIVTALDYITIYGNEVAVFFKAPLSTGDQTTLAALVAANTGVPIVPELIAQKVVQVLGADTLTLSPFGSLISPAAGTLTNCDVLIPMAVVLRGGIVFSPNSAMGDWFSVSVIDKDNVTGQGGTPDSPTILATYITSWYMMPGIENCVEDVSISEQLPQGLYMRIAYTSVGTTAPNVLINFITYVGTP